MIKLFTLFFVGFLTVTVKAEIYQCNFTEPFIIVSIDRTKKLVTWSTPGEEDQTVPLLGLKIGLTSVLHAEFEVRNVRHQLEIDFDVKGSDGMSDFIYPSEGRLNRSYGGQGGQLGGCFDEVDKPVCPPNGSC